ncbi:hypothetical protein PAMP_016966 [Pampus punctatissimus]
MCDSKLVQQFRVSGRCSELLFQVEFQISDVKQSQRSERTISSLNVVMDANDLQNFSTFLSGKCVLCQWISITEQKSNFYLLYSISVAKPHLDCVVQSAESGKQQMEKYLR